MLQCCSPIGREAVAFVHTPFYTALGRMIGLRHAFYNPDERLQFDSG